MRAYFLGLVLLAVLAAGAPAKDKDPERSKPEPAKPAEVALAAGQKAPAFSLQAFPAGKVRLKDFQGKWLALCFYPKANAPKDVMQMASLREVWPELVKREVAVLGVSMDPSAVVEKFRTEQALPFSLACDETKSVSAAYGALGLGGLFSTRRAVLINPQGVVVDIIDKCPEKQYGPRILERIKALQAPGKPD